MKHAMEKAGITQTVKCPYCGREAKLVGGNVIYPHRRDLYEKKFYQCAPCDAYVGCHHGTTNALGRLASAELRAAKMDAHAAFDQIWKSGLKKRGSAYAWLADALDMDKKQCHIGMFDVADCLRVVAACAGHNALPELRTDAVTGADGCADAIRGETK